MLEELNSYTQALNAETPWLLPLSFAMFGACVGSFLNVVIYRVPRGMSVNEPRRSFCPDCRKEIPWYLNMPILSWLLLRGRSACCHKPIPARYCIVEVLTALLFAGIAWHFSPDPLVAQILLCVWGAIMLAVFYIDWELMEVQPVVTGLAVIPGLGVAGLAPWLVEPMALTAEEGVLWSLFGAVSGFLLLKLVAVLGRLLFGRQRSQYAEDKPWQLQQAGDDLELMIGEERYLWSEIFMEATNKLCLHGATINPGSDQPGTITFGVSSVTTEDGTVIELEHHERLSGTCCGFSTRKEAMGSGDAHIALAIGAVCGWQGVLFALVAGSFIGIAQALAARIGRGVPMPFGPAFITGAGVYLFFGQSLINAYFNSFAH